MKVSVKEKNGSYMVLNNGERVAEKLSNSQAWKMADKITNEPTSRQEDVYAWKAKKDASNE
jgi:hypothetical protein